jgi:hypothetical protein
MGCIGDCSPSPALLQPFLLSHTGSAAVLIDELDASLLQRIPNRVGLFISPSKESVGRVQGC